MFKIVMTSVLLLFAAAVSGCATTETSQKIDNAIQKSLPQICDQGTQVYAAFVVVEATGKVPAAKAKKVHASYAALEVVCKDPTSVNSSTVLLKAAQAFAAFEAASNAVE